MSHLLASDPHIIQLLHRNHGIVHFGSYHEKDLLGNLSVNTNAEFFGVMFTDIHIGATAYQ